MRAALTGSYTKFIHFAAATPLGAPIGMTIVSNQDIAPSSGNTKRTSGFGDWAMSPDQAMQAAKFPFSMSCR